MKKYNAPEITITKFAAENIITASGMSAIDKAINDLEAQGAPTGAVLGTIASNYWSTMSTTP